MDRLESTANIISALNGYNDKSLDEASFITQVCSFFDNIKDSEITHSDKQFLLYLANSIGVPHYFDMLRLDDNLVDIPKNIGLSAFSSFMHEASLTIGENAKVHRYQKQIYDLFNDSQVNRFFLSASTSFGKTFLVYEVIKKMGYENILLIFPTIALLAENLERLKEEENYSFFRDNYNIHTLSDTLEAPTGKHVFLFTPERYLSFMDKNPDMPEFDFCFVDEVYKIDNDYLIDEEARENDRDVAYRLATYEIFTRNPQADSLLVGPYIKLPETSDSRRSFFRFLEKFNITSIDKNAIEIVNKSRYNVPNTNQVKEFEDLTFDFSLGRNKGQQFKAVINEIKAKGENAIVYCSTKAYVESYALSSFQDTEDVHSFAEYQDFISHIESKFSPDWVVPRALKKGIGIHHGVVPKYIQKEIINLFNRGLLKLLFSTTTITEGVNTTAKNIVVLHHRKGDKILKQFDAKNIEGRAGRFLAHYKGRVIILDPVFQEIINQEGEIIKHKNFDIATPKDDIDLEITSDEYLTQENLSRREELIRLQEDRAIPESVMAQFRAISRADKIIVYDKILTLTAEEHAAILELIRKISYANPEIDYDGFQVVLSTFESIVKDSKLIHLLGKSEYNREVPDEYSRITHKLHFYLKDGFMGAVEYQKLLGNDINKAIREASEFIYNTLKYQLVKYLGVFNNMYKYERSLHLGTELEEVRGIDRLLIKLEYNAYSIPAKIASDYGAPYNVIKFFDADSQSQRTISLDSFEAQIKDKIAALIISQNGNN
jgi:hypothetical protein